MADQTRYSNERSGRERERREGGGGVEGPRVTEKYEERKKRRFPINPQPIEPIVLSVNRRERGKKYSGYIIEIEVFSLSCPIGQYNW